MRRALFAVLAALLVAAVAELVSAVGLRVLAEQWVGYVSLAHRRLGVLEGSGRPTRGAALAKVNLLGRYFGEVVLHPYLGFVGNPDAQAPGTGDSNSVDLGFPDNPQDVLQKRSSDKLIVGFFGGSLANILADLGRESFVEELQRSGRFSGKEVVLVSLAMGGYKQPQQLMALSYLLVMGGDLDVVVNIDGFNEVALPPAELEPWDVFPLYPRNWAYRVSSLGPELRRVLGRIDYLEEIRRRRAATFSHPILARSLSAGLVWTVVDARLDEEILAAHESLMGEELIMEDYQLKGPRSRLGFESNPMALLVETWSLGSLQMHRLCRANGIEYYHFLQPNQYLPDAKPLSREELQTAFRQDHKYRRGVVEGYPLLQIAGEELRQQGVAFHDLTGLFREIERTLYVDDCCHVNVEGNQIIAHEVGGIVSGTLP